MDHKPNKNGELTQISKNPVKKSKRAILNEQR